MLQVSGLSKSFGGVQAVTDVSMEVRQGEIVGLVGPNGAGKTTLFNMVSHFITYDRGEIRFKGESLTRMSAQQIAKRGILRTFQTPIGFPKLSCIENLMVVPAQKGESVWTSLLGAGRVRKEERAIYDKAVGLLEEVSLYDKRNELAANLSAAELKLLELSRLRHDGLGRVQVVVDQVVQDLIKVHRLRDARGHLRAARG